jgi:dipeptidyl aminopeptidase/acylaminoacyl peptidase
MQMNRRGQQWVFENLYRVAGSDLMFPGATGFRLERGYKYADIQKTNERIKSFSINTKEWARTARQIEQMAEEAEAHGHLITARDFYYRAALYYGRGQWSINADTPYKREVHAKCVAAFQKVCDQSDGLIQRVDIPFGDSAIAAVLHLPPQLKPGQKVPCVIFYPGMDMFKEEFPNALDNPYAKRGVAILTLDGPGQGETRLRGIFARPGVSEAAGSAAIDYLRQRPDIDPAKIAVQGASFGSYWGPRLAAADPRIKACAGIMGILYSMDPIFNLAPPSFRHAFMFMAGMENDEEFDNMASQMGLEGVGAKLTCPTLITQGEIDALCPLPGAHKFFAEIAGPKEMWVYEHESHPLGGVMAELIPKTIDWIVDALEGRILPDHARSEFIEVR